MGCIWFSLSVFTSCLLCSSVPPHDDYPLSTLAVFRPEVFEDAGLAAHCKIIALQHNDNQSPNLSGVEIALFPMEPH